MPKICHIITTLYESSGSTRRTLAEVDHLMKKGWSVHLIIGKDASSSLIAECVNNGIEVFQINCLRKYIHPFLEIKALFRIAAILKEQKYDIVHTHLAKGGILGRLAGAKAGNKIIVHTVHGPSFPKSKNWLLRSLYIFFEKIAGKFTDAIVFVGKEIGDIYMQAKIASPDQSHLIYTGRNFKDFEHARGMSKEQKNVIRDRHGIHKDDIVLGCVGRIVPSKGHMTAIRVMHKLSQTYPKVKLMIIGKANLPDEQYYKSRLLDMIRELGLEKNIVFIDYQKEIALYYAVMDLFILPSSYEGLPNVILEAAVMGIPIVAFDCGGVKEIFKICPNAGWSVPVGDMDGFYNCVEATVRNIYAHRNDDRRSERFSETISENWSVDGMLRRTDSLYEYLLETSSFLKPATPSDGIKVHQQKITTGG
jgi:glycosyltransferase involved in cell wall biosynthesis